MRFLVEMIFVELGKKCVVAGKREECAKFKNIDLTENHVDGPVAFHLNNWPG